MASSAVFAGPSVSQNPAPHWYALVIRSRQEKQVAQQLEVRSVECFLPTYTSVRNWKDRRVQLEMPLFPGYLFVRHPLVDRLRVLTVNGACRLVSFQGGPAPLVTAEIERLRTGLAAQLRLEPHPFLKLGQKVRIRCGPLAGAEGILTRKPKDGLRVVLAMDVIMQSAAVEVSPADIEAV